MANPPAAGGPAAPPLPADVVQNLVDRAAHFNMFSMPDHAAPGGAIRAAPGGPIIGVVVHEALHRFVIATRPPAGAVPLTATSVIGERAGTFTHRWLFTPDDFVAAPDRKPPPTRIDPSVSQRFVMLDGMCTFGDGSDGFRSFGTGHTLPTAVDGAPPHLLALAVGTILEGFGKFEGLEEGTFVYCGTLAPERGFTGNVLLRVIDPKETFRTYRAMPPLEAHPNPEPDVTYVIFRGQAVASDPVIQRLGADGRPIGLTVEQGIRLLGLDFKASGPGGLQSTATIGPSVGRIIAHVTFDPNAAPGTALHPVPFTSSDEFVFFEREGAVPVGGFTANSSEGRVFHTQLRGQQAIRFGGVGCVLGGTGSFQGINGVMTDNSVVVFAPHVSASLYVLRIHDPHHEFRERTARR